MSTTAPLTLEQAERLSLPEDRLWELHEGELVEVTLPSFLHKLIQQRIERLMSEIFSDQAIVLAEMPFRLKDRSDDYRSADIGVLSIPRRPTSDQRIVNGAPEFVIEVLSPSNTVRGTNKRKQVCAKNGGEFFWIVDPEDLEVTVIDLKDPTVERKYGIGSSVPVRALGIQSELPVAAIFDGIAG